MVKSPRKKKVPDASEAAKEHEEQPSPSASPHRPAEDLSESDEVFDRFFGEVDEYALLLLDAEGHTRRWNRGAEKMLGYSFPKAPHVRILFTPDDRDKGIAKQFLENASAAGKANYEGWLVRKEGTRFWAAINLTALHRPDGGVHGYLKIIHDLTDKKMAEDNYSNFVEELKLKNEALKNSEERYHKMVSEVTDYAIILMDRDGKILDWNKGAEKVKGYAASEIIGKSFRLFYPKEEKDAGLPERLLAEARKNGRVTHEGWRVRKDGSRYWGNITITALHNDNGEIIGFSKVARDLTEMKVTEDRVKNILEELRQANEKLKENEERYQRMIAEIQDYAIILLDRNGDVLNWNRGAQLIKGYAAEEIVGRNFRLFYPPDDRARNLPETLLTQAARQGKATHEGWRVRKDGTRFWGSIVITALHNNAGDVIGFSKVTRDLTERKNAEDLLRQNAAQLDLKNKTLERLNEELSSFSYVASHDMKEPLRKILTFASRIESAAFDPDASREILEKIRASATTLQNLIDDLLSYSQVANDDRRFRKVDLNAVLEDVKSDLEVAIADKSAVIVADRLPVLSGVPHQLHQLFQNLISNALKFSRKEEPPRVEIRCERIKGPDLPGDMPEGNNQYHHISIADNGIGFSQHEHDKIFEAFQRLNPKHAFSGSGIGLAIVKKIVENHNGIVNAEGTPGAGATFHVYLPVA